MRRLPALLVAFTVISLIASGCGSTLADAATIRYSLEGSAHVVHVTRDDLLGEVSKLVVNKPFATWLKKNGYAVNSDVSTDTAVSAIWLSSLIRQQAIDALFSSRHVHVSSAIRAQATKDAGQVFPPGVFSAFDAKFRATLTDRQIRVEAVLASYIDTSDAAGQKFYKAHESAFACASGKNVAHILVATRAAAQRILQQLAAGASFSKLAQADSTDTGSGAQGGALGCLTAGAFVPQFENAASAAPFDKPIGPVQTQFGFHVILVTHATTSSYAAVRAQVLNELAREDQAAAAAARDALLKSFKVHLDPRFGTWELTTDRQGQKSYQVTPPEAPNPSTRREGTTTTATVPVAPPGTSTGNP